MKKNLPIGQSSFENIIRNNNLYVDKTQYIYNLITTTQFNFLSRPRRFGKSLLISTLEQIFRGNKELFKGLWIYEADYSWEGFPTITLDFNQVVLDSPESLQSGIVKNIRQEAQQYGLTLNEEEPKYILMEAVKKLYEEFSRQVVVLIDEYDKPIITHLGMGKERLQIAIKNREHLRSFYGTLKGSGVIDNLRFVLLTGVSKFSKAGVFSELNNLFDLTMDSRYASMLGITDEEVDIYFREHMQDYADSRSISYEEAREEVRRYYNGYRFSRSETKVYNPFSLINLLAKKELANYWFESGTPTFLVNLIKERNYNIAEAEEYPADDTIFTAYELEDLQITALLFQTGYLTIKSYDNDRMRYTLTYPNLEVKNSFLKLLYKSFARDEYNLYTKIYDTLLEGDIDSFISVIQSIFASISYDEGSRLNEANFHTLFYLMVTAGGLPAQSQVLNYMGRIDMVVELKKKVYVFEFKCNQSAKEAIQQIINRDYHRQYLNTSKEVYLVGIDFDVQKRNIGEYKFRQICSSKDKA